MIVKCTLNGVNYELPANHSREISNSEEALSEGGFLDPVAVEILKNLPRVGTTGKGLPVVQDDNGKKLYLRAACLKQEGDGTCHNYISNGTQRVAAPKVKAWEDLSEEEQAAWNEIKKACKDDVSKASYEAIRPKTRAEIEAEQAELRKQMKIAALQAQLAALMAE